MKKVGLLLVGLTITSTTQLHSTNYLQSWINYFSAQAHNSYTYVQNIDWQKHSQNISSQAKNAYTNIPTQEQIARTMQENPQATAATGFFATIIGLRGLQSYWNAQKTAKEKNAFSGNTDNLVSVNENVKKFSEKLIEIEKYSNDLRKIGNDISSLHNNVNNLISSLENHLNESKNRK
ncbi:MAG: hypothetical protein ACXWL2_03420 [Candidatus Chromulinivorax sp.]